jgi:[ribosomal protein S5]-alanine N-acetyltransferase
MERRGARFVMELQTERLRLAPLAVEQLRCYVEAPDDLERQLGFPVSRGIVTEPLRRAIETKISLMEGADPAQHPWYTYWLVIVGDRPYGAGLAGFKGLPNSQGEAEIGYGIDAAYRSRGYTTEAVKRLIEWAFENGACRAVIARTTNRQNVASNRVLENVGMRVYCESAEALDWRVDNAATTRIERATREQAGRLFEIMVRATEVGCAASYPPEIIAIWHKGRSVEGMAGVIAQSHVYSLIDGDSVRGFVHTGDSEVLGLFVDPHDHRKGYGAALFRFAVDKIGVRPIVVRATLNAVPFYTGLGCRRVAVELVRRHGHDIYVERMELG